MTIIWLLVGWEESLRYSVLGRWIFSWVTWGWEKFLHSMTESPETEILLLRSSGGFLALILPEACRPDFSLILWISPYPSNEYLFVISLTRLILVAYAQRSLTYVGIMKEIRRRSKIYLDLTVVRYSPSLCSVPWKKCAFPLHFCWPRPCDCLWLPDGQKVLPHPLI